MECFVAIGEALLQYVKCHITVLYTMETCNIWTIFLQGQRKCLIIILYFSIQPHPSSWASSGYTFARDIEDNADLKKHSHVPNPNSDSSNVAIYKQSKSKFVAIISQTAAWNMSPHSISSSSMESPSGRLPKTKCWAGANKLSQDLNWFILVCAFMDP